jgi:shikimate dehydrogenase
MIETRAGVVGWPVEHSRSPTIHRYWLRNLGLSGSYEKFAVRPGEFCAFVDKIGRDELAGANVTLPHKEAAFSACDQRTPVAEALGAVNTLWRQDGRLMGDNTDVAGFLANMDEAAPGWSERPKAAVVIGAGGAARAIVYALVSRGFERVAIANRTQARAEALAAHFGGSTTALPWADLASASRDADLLVNASSLGMVGQPPLTVDLTDLPRRAVVADAIYVPLRTPLIEAARTRGLRTVEGLGMLLHQAAPAFARWFGRQPVVTAELRALVEAEVAATHEAAS